MNWPRRGKPKTVDYASPGARGVFLGGVLAGALRALLRQPDDEMVRRQARKALNEWEGFTRER